jgi:hypothetical protein
MIRYEGGSEGAAIKYRGTASQYGCELLRKMSTRKKMKEITQQLTQIAENCCILNATQYDEPGMKTGL